MIDVRLPEEVLEGLPAGKDEMVRYLVPYIDAAIAEYEQSLRRRVTGSLGGPLDRHEKSILRDFMLDRILRNVIQEDPRPVDVLHEGPFR